MLEMVKINESEPYIVWKFYTFAPIEFTNRITLQDHIKGNIFGLVALHFIELNFIYEEILS